MCNACAASGFSTPQTKTVPPLAGLFSVYFRFLLPAHVVQVVVLASEEFLRELRDDFRIVVLAREDIQVHGVGAIREVCRDEGCFDELCHRISRHSLVFAEIDDNALAEPLHLDEIAQFDHKPLDFFRRPDGLRIASVDIDPRM